MSRATDSTPSPASAGGSTPPPAIEQLAGKHVCPFCGTVRASSAEPCPRCTMEDTAATRQATKARIGPWYVLQTRNPAAPGMKFATLLSLIKKGQITARSIVRGPTTHQLWRFAAHVRGVSREFGICYSCGEAIEQGASTCRQCERTQEAPIDPDQLLDGRAPQPPAAMAPIAEAPPRAPRTYEIPARPPAQLPVRTPNAGHAERLRMFNNEGAVNRPRANFTPRSSGNQLVSGMDLASAFHPDATLSDDEPVHGTKRGLIGVMVVLILLGGGILFYIRPDYRQQSLSWLGEQWHGIQARVNASHAPQQHLPPPTMNGESDVAADHSSSIAPSNGAQPEPPAPQKIADVPANVPTNLPGNLPGNVSGNVERGNPSGAAPDLSAADSASSKTTPAPAGKPEADSTASRDDSAEKPERMSTDDAIEKSRTLWSRAIDAEGRNDFAQAVKCYEQIEKLPREAWPSTLLNRLTFARKQVKQ